ncbi:MAG TPA: PH domain-containing protein [Acidimicrobiia bacterium]|nr:PH domain-containing protein [Acidimicrobiia bacterium]
MAYPDNLVQEGETVALDLRPHWWFFSRNILTGIPLAIILLLVLGKQNSDWQKYTAAIVGIATLVWAAWLGLKYLQWRMTYFVVTSRRVIYRSGVISKRGVEIPLERINNINFHQRLIDRVIGAGDLDIESAGKDGQSHFDFIRHPDGVQHEVYRQMESRNMPVAMMQPAAAAASPPPGAAVPEQIEQLARLRDQGHITEAEFEAKKAELLGRM